MAPTVGEGEDGALRVLVLSKRQYMAKDLLGDRYGRFRELPLALAALGARVEGLCLSYRGREELALVDSEGAASVAWRSLNLRTLLSPGAQGYWKQVDAIASRLRPQVVWACSDVLHAVLGVRVARRLGCKLVVDLYDNYEGYPVARIPGAIAALRRALRAADGVTCVSEPLRRKVVEDYGFGGDTFTLGNAIPEQRFRPGDRRAARARFGLPQDAFLVGVAGALARGRGTDLLLDAFGRLSPEWPDLHLVLAGPGDGSLDISSSARLHALGLLPADAVPALLPAFDVSVVGNRDSEFGRFCFPQKLYESLACAVPVAVARVGAVADLLREHPACLYEPESVESLVATLRALRAHPFVPPLPIPTWPMLGRELDAFLRRLGAN